MFVVLPETAELHRASVIDRGSKRTVATLCGLQVIFGNSNRNGRRAERPRVFPNPPARAMTSGEFQLCVACEQQKPNRPAVRTELSDEAKEMLREMNRRHAATRNTDAPDAA